MNNDFVKQTCKLGQMVDCCKYLMMGSSGFECAKINPSMKAIIDARASIMHAKGDNCPGFGTDNETTRRQQND